MTAYRYDCHARAGENDVGKQRLKKSRNVKKTHVFLTQCRSTIKEKQWDTLIEPVKTPKNHAQIARKRAPFGAKHVRIEAEQVQSKRNRALLPLKYRRAFLVKRVDAFLAVLRGQQGVIVRQFTG